MDKVYGDDVDTIDENYAAGTFNGFQALVWVGSGVKCFENGCHPACSSCTAHKNLYVGATRGRCCSTCHVCLQSFSCLVCFGVTL